MSYIPSSEICYSRIHSVIVNDDFKEVDSVTVQSRKERTEIE